MIVRDEQPALWALEQDYTGPTGEREGAPVSSRACASRTTARAGSGPTSAPTRARRRTGCGSRAPPRPTCHRSSRCTPIPPAPPRSALAQATNGHDPWGQATDDDGTVNRLWRIDDAATIATIHDALDTAELLIADGHHRYETARVYAEEIGGDGPHRYVLMCLVALEDPGLTVFPTHRLLRDLRPDQHEALADAIRRDFDIKRLDSTDELVADLRAAGQPRLHRRPLPPAVHAHAQGPGDRRRRRCQTTPSPTAGSTPPCSRR